jgi:hypothetical protein
MSPSRIIAIVVVVNLIGWVLHGLIHVGRNDE